MSSHGVKVVVFLELVGGMGDMTSEPTWETLWSHDMEVSFFCPFFFLCSNFTKVSYVIYKFKTIQKV